MMHLQKHFGGLLPTPRDANLWINMDRINHGYANIQEYTWNIRSMKCNIAPEHWLQKTTARECKRFESGDMTSS